MGEPWSLAGAMVLGHRPARPLGLGLLTKGVGACGHLPSQGRWVLALAPGRWGGARVLGPSLVGPGALALAAYST